MLLMRNTVSVFRRKKNPFFSSTVSPYILQNCSKPLVPGKTRTTWGSETLRVIACRSMTVCKTLKKMTRSQPLLFLAMAHVLMITWWWSYLVAPADANRAHTTPRGEGPSVVSASEVAAHRRLLHFILSLFFCLNIAEGCLAELLLNFYLNVQIANNVVFLSIMVRLYS